MTKSKRFTTLLLITILIFCTTSVFGQGIVTGSISGVVQDGQKAVISGAKVVAKNLATGIESTTTTNEFGFYTLRSLPIGDYSVAITQEGFKNLKVSGITVSVGKETSLGIQSMAVGANSLTVMVEGAAPLVDTQGAQVVAAFDEKKIADLPINNGFDSLALFTPGVVSTGQSRFGNTNGANFSVNGQRPRSNNFQIDGQANNDPTVTGPSFFVGNTDVIAEIQVVSQFSAEYGRNTGSVVNYTTKAGSNAFHGTAFDFYTPGTFDSLTNSEKNKLVSSTFCAPGENPSATGCTKPTVSKYVEHRWGGTLGGPVIKDKLFFFGSYLENPNRVGNSPATGSTYTFTPQGIQQLAAAFPNAAGVKLLQALSPAAYAVGNPSFEPVPEPYVSNGKCVGEVDPQLPVVAGNPCANYVRNSQIMITGPGATTAIPISVGHVTRFVPSLYNDREVTGRVDYQLTEKDHFFGRYLYQKNISTVAAGTISTAQWVDVPGKDQQIGLDWVRAFSDTLTNQMRFSYFRLQAGFFGGSNSDCTLTSLSSCPPSISIVSSAQQSFGLANTYPQGRIVNNYQVQDNATKVYGKHTFKFGGEFLRQRAPNVFLTNYNGTYSFADFNALVSNRITSLSLADGSPTMRFTENDITSYVQDDWRIRPNLTLNIGMRYELYGNAVNALHDFTVAGQKSADPFWDPSLPLSRTTVPYVKADKNNFAPVVGFSYSPGGDQKTVVRGGFRIAYDAPFANMALNTGTSAPVANANTLTPAANPGITLPSSGFTGADVRAANLGFMPSGAGMDPGMRTQTTIDPNFHEAYSEQWNIGIQRYITNKMAVEVRYVGSHSVGLYSSINGNPYVQFYRDALNGTGSFTAPAINQALYDKLVPAGVVPCADRSMPGFGYADCTRRIVIERGNDGWSKYHGIQTRFDVQNWHGLTASFNYTHSKNTDNSSDAYSVTASGNFNINPNPFNFNTLRDGGSSGLDYPNAATITLNYEFPWMKKQAGIVGRILGGWQANTTWRYSSGQPWTPYQYRATTGTGSPCDPGNSSAGGFAFSASGATDACRPILNNADAPFATYGYLRYTASTNTYSVYNYATGALVTSDQSQISSALGQFHWVRNDLASAMYFQMAPWEMGVQRNELRGDTVNNVNFSMYKSTKITERFTLQLQANVFNVLNRMYLGIPDNFLNDVTTSKYGLTKFGSNHWNNSGAGVVNGTNDGIGRRRLMFGAKVIF